MSAAGISAPARQAPASPAAAPGRAAAAAAPRLRALLVAAALALGCASDPAQGEPAVEPTPVACQLGLGLGAAFTPLQGRPKVELVLGFQGFVWIDLALRLDEGAPGDALAKVKAAYTVAGDEARSTQLATTFAAGRTASLRLLLAPADVKKLHGREADLALRAEVAGLRCDAEGGVLLADDDPCIHVDGRRDCGAPGPP